MGMEGRCKLVLELMYWSMYSDQIRTPSHEMLVHLGAKLDVPVTVLASLPSLVKYVLCSRVWWKIGRLLSTLSVRKSRMDLNLDLQCD